MSREEIEEWAFVFLRPICNSDEHADTYIKALFSGLSKRGVVIKKEGELSEALYHSTEHLDPAWVEEAVKEDMLLAGYTLTEPLIEQV